MKQALVTRIITSVISLLMLVAVSAPTVMLIADDLFSDHCSEECENHCEDDCEGCGDCIHCVPLHHMILGNHPSDLPADHDAAWAVVALSHQELSSLPNGIDRPPQNS